MAEKNCKKTEAAIKKMVLPPELTEILNRDGVEVIIPNSREELGNIAMGGPDNMTFDIEYEVEGKGIVKEAWTTRCKNGVAANYYDTYMRRRDPDSMIVADDLPTDRAQYEQLFGKKFADLRQKTFEWIAAQPGLLCMPFMAGTESLGLAYQALLIAPKNARFFAAGLADLQGFVPLDEIPDKFTPKAIIYVAPTFRHTHFDGNQRVVHNRLPDMHEIFSYNLYPGPSAKKGIYGVLLNIGEKEGWLTAHGSTVKVITPYEMSLSIMHEGASGGGKSEMLEQVHRQTDGKILVGENIVTGESFELTLTDSCELHPVTDDMALCHPSLQNESGKLVIADAENGWFLRVNHITKYGTEPAAEYNTIHPTHPLIFINMDAQPGSTILLWEHIMDAPGKPCPNPRVIMPRAMAKNHVNGSVEVDVRSFGLRQPPSTKENPNYGITGLFHVLPPALAWLWRLVAPRGHSNPSITDTEGMQSEGVGSYWPFATGKMVDQANLLLNQILATPSTRYILVPNQYVGAYKTGFAPQWITREFLARRGGAKFKHEQLITSRCPVLGYTPEKVKIDGIYIPKGLLRTNLQPELGDAGYDAGAKVLTGFFKTELEKFLRPELNPLGKAIIEACMKDASVEDYFNFIPKL